MQVLWKGGRFRGGRWGELSCRGGTRSVCCVAEPSQSAYAVGRGHLDAVATISAVNRHL